MDELTLDVFAVEFHINLVEALLPRLVLDGYRAIVIILDDRLVYVSARHLYFG
jgi:hypothetical protein